MPQIKDYNAKTTPDSTDEFVFQETAAGETKKITLSNMQKGLQSQIDSLIANPVLPTGYIEGLEISNNGTDADHDIDIATGSCKDDTGAVDLILSSAFTKQIDAAWSAGTNAGGLDTGTVAADTFYYFFLIEKDSDNSIDVLISASPTSPTMPAGYTKKRRIRGAVLTDSSSNIIQFKQKDNYFNFGRQLEDYSTLTSTNTKTDIMVSVPPNMLGYFTFIMVGGASYYGWLRRTDCIDIAPTLQYHDQRTATDQTSVVKMVLTDSSSQISYRVDTNGVDVYVYTNGFFDNAEI